MSPLGLTPEQLVGVLDLKDGRAVHAIAGRRETYCPVTVCQGDASKLAARYLQRGAGALYIADLDALTGRLCQYTLVESILRHHPHVPTWIDLGWHQRWDENACNKLTRLVDEFPETRWIVATEAAQQPDSLQNFTALVPPSRACVSLDYHHGELNAQTGSAMKWTQTAVALGFGSVLVLDVAAVGTASGPVTAARCVQLRPILGCTELLSGGGIRNERDAQSLVDAGCQRLLVATALH